MLSECRSSLNRKVDSSTYVNIACVGESTSTDKRDKSDKKILCDYVYHSSRTPKHPDITSNYLYMYTHERR